jgi:hypothetical protein
MALQTGRSSTKYAILSAAAMVAAGIALPSPVRAADLGGNCCADLEERVAELEATTARKGNRKVSLTISGQVSTAVMGWSDGGSDSIRKNPDFGKVEKASPVLHSSGRGDDVYVVDNVMSGGTYFALTGSAKINPNVSAGFNVTIAMDTGGRSHQTNQFDDDGTASGSGDNSTGGRIAGGFDTDIVLTLANWYLDHKDLGRVTVGRINTATAGLTTIDLGGAGVIANANIGYTQRGMFLTINDTAQISATTTWAQALGGNTVNGAGLSRGNAISYSTPTFGGFTASTAWGEDDVWDVALRYAGERSGFRVAAGIGYAHNAGGLGDFSESFDAAGAAQDKAKINQWKGSASILHVATGLYLTSAYVNQDNDDDRPGLSDNTTLWYVQGGVSKNWTGLGNTTLYGEYARVNDARVDFKDLGGTLTGVDSRVWGIGVVQAIDAAAMDVFLAYRQYSTDEQGRNPENFNDFNVVMGGARIKF